MIVGLCDSSTVVYSTRLRLRSRQKTAQKSSTNIVCSHDQMVRYCLTGPGHYGPVVTSNLPALMERNGIGKFSLA